MATVHGTIDSVSMQHLCRPAKVKKTRKSKEKLGLEIIEDALRDGRLHIYLDSGGGLSGEWHSTCDPELIKSLIVKWSDLKGISTCTATGAIRPDALRKNLRKCAFNDAGDKLLVRIGLSALATFSATNPDVVPFRITTNDGDFWNPLDSSEKGDPNAVVARLLQTANISSTLLENFFLLI